MKYIRSLKEKKNRSEFKTFVAEGNKMVSELLTCLDCELLLASSSFLQNADLSRVGEAITVSEKELSQASFLRNPQEVLAVFKQPVYSPDVDLSSQLCLALDGIQDPGNMGTIVRLADWYGIQHIFCSEDTADIYNPKVVQATMGAIARVKVHYVDLVSFLQQVDVPIYGTLLDGENMYEKSLSDTGILVMGNEGNGIRPEVENLISEKLFIPNFPADASTSESLNVAIATAIVCAEFRRRSF